MEIYLTKMIFNPQSRQVWNDLGNLQNLHRTISSAFPPIENQDGLPHHERRTPRNEFNLLHRLDYDRRSGRAVLLVQSSVKPDWSFLHEGYAREIKCKAVHEQYAAIENEKLLLFRLQANPTKRIGQNYRHPDERKREEFTRKFRDEKNRRRISLNTDEERIEWLMRKGADAGFRLAKVQIKTDVENVAAIAQSKIKSR
ncbi:MAG: type I-E CRISPR-associated protein Cas6/Cse3/CasE, partial [Pyrinomonadaceae bacterium]